MVYTVRRLHENAMMKSRDHEYFKKGVGWKDELICFRSITGYILKYSKEQGSETKERVTRAAEKKRTDLKRLMIKEEIREVYVLITFVQK